MKKIVTVLLFALLAVDAFAQTQSISQIRAKWNQLKPQAGVKTYEREPSAKQPYSAGRLALDFTNNGKNMLNFARYLAGLSAAEWHTYNLQCQNGALSQTPPQPAGMNTHGEYQDDYNAVVKSNPYKSSANSATLEEAVRSWLNDSDSSNIRTLRNRLCSIKYIVRSLT